MDTGSCAYVSPAEDKLSVRIFVRRVNITLLGIMMIGIFVIFYSVYLPLKNALETSLIDNFSQISYVSYHSLQSNMERGLEGARSLSSRTMIKNAIAEYQNHEIDMDALKSFTESKYEDGAKALEHLILAERFVEDTLIARYSPVTIHNCGASCFRMEGAKMLAEICLSEDHVYFSVLSPIAHEHGVLGYDYLVFDLTAELSKLSTNTIETILLPDDGFLELLSKTKSIKNAEGFQVLNDGEFYYHVIPMEGDIYFISKQGMHILFAQIYDLSLHIFLIGIGALLVFIIIIYLYVLRYARKELVHLHNSHGVLKKAASQANLDVLTQIGGRRYGEERLTQAFFEFRRSEISPALIIFDIDRLKHINDAYGHSVGDQVIKAIASALQSNIRNNDTLFRWGGDEFAGIFCGIQEEHGIRFVDKLLEAVSSIEIVAGEVKISPTVSAGISYFQKNDMSFLDAFNRADQAMYQSKAKGRNRANLL